MKTIATGITGICFLQIPAFLTSELFWKYAFEAVVTVGTLYFQYRQSKNKGGKDA